MKPVQRELLWGVYWSLFWFIAPVAAVLNNPLRSSTRVWFTVLGTTTEIAGVLLIASPELLPLIVRVVRWSRDLSRDALTRIGQHLRTVFRLPPPAVAGTSSIAIGVGLVGGEDRQISNPPEVATIAEKVEWLLEAYQKLDDSIDELEKTVAQHPYQWRGEIAKSQEAAETVSRTLVRSLADRNLALRLLGVLYVLIGLVLSMVGHLVG